MSNDTKAIWTRFSGEIRGFITRKVNDGDAVDDILQTIFVKIHNNINGLRNSDKIRGWIYQIAKTTIVDFYRENSKRLTLAQINVGLDNDIAKEGDEVLSRGIQSIIRLLPEKYAEAIYLTEYEGVSQVGLAKILGLSISGAKSRVQRARSQFRNLLLEFCHIEFDIYGAPIEYRAKNCHICIKKSNSV